MCTKCYSVAAGMFARDAVGVFVGDAAGVFGGDAAGVFVGDVGGVFGGDAAGVLGGDAAGVFGVGCCRCVWKRCWDTPTTEHFFTTSFLCCWRMKSHPGDAFGLKDTSWNSS